MAGYTVGCLRPSEDQRLTLWDPLSAWPAGRRWLWLALAVFVVLALGYFRMHDRRGSNEDVTCSAGRG